MVKLQGREANGQQRRAVEAGSSSSGGVGAGQSRPEMAVMLQRNRRRCVGGVGVSSATMTETEPGDAMEVSEQMVVVSALYRVPFREALALGFLMNTKGLVELIVLNIRKDGKVLNDQTFAIMVVMALFTTFITTPAKRASKADYKHKTKKINK